MGERKNPLDRALDVFVYAPLGLVVSAREIIPTLAEKGREAFTNARAMGEFALGMGQEEANKVVRNLFPDNRRGGSSRNGRPASQTSAAPASAYGSSPSLVAAPGPSPVPRAEAPPEVTMAIPGYDALSASQVVPRLEGLSTTELEAVRAYEEAGRGRKTVLSRIAQLQTG
jgi:hypothetical protein